MNSRDLISTLEPLRRWGDTGRLMAEHILGCQACRTAEYAGGAGYCLMGDKIWAAMMQVESEIMALVPTLKANGIDVDEFFRETGFRFYKGAK